jgi:hypothetical protein
MKALAVQLTPGFSGVAGRVLSESLSLGAIAPFPPFAELSQAELGMVGDVAMRAVGLEDPSLSSVVRLGDVLSRSDVAPGDLVNGRGFVLVAVGNALGAPDLGVGHPMTYAIVRAEP